MSVRELVVLGCGSQVPSRERNHNGYLLRWDGEGLLFDPGEGTQRQLIFAGVRPAAITRILITHFHGDHCLGLPGILQRLSLDGVQHPLHLYYPASGAEYLERLRRASIYHDRLELVLHPIARDGVVDEGEGFVLEARRLAHPVDTFGYRLAEPPQRHLVPEALRAHGVSGPAAGELKRRGAVEIGGRRVLLHQVSREQAGAVFAFVMDTRPCAAAHALARGANLLVCEATYLDSEREHARAYGHMTAGEALALARAAGVRRVVLAHLSQRYRDAAPYRAALAAATLEHPAGEPEVIIAEDLLRIAVPRHR
ncbi:MAG: ribonuclease Z [Planctomycetota bacterium]|nr:MAG: ribonuclease Z [Planctomycetota bacterium]